jgi:hypothetical protein
MASDYKEIIRDLKNKIFKPVYFLAGKEPYFIDLITDFIEDNVLDESEKDFNQTVLYGPDVSNTGHRDLPPLPDDVEPAGGHCAGGSEDEKDR